MLDTPTLELAVILVVSGGAVAGISLSVAMRNKRSKMTTNLSTEHITKNLDHRDTTSTDQNRTDFLERTETSVKSESTNDMSQVTHQIPPTSPLAPLVKTFQSPSSQSESSYPSSFFTDAVVAEATAPKEEFQVSEQKEVSEEEKERLENIAPVSVSFDEMVSPDSRIVESEPSLPPASALALPTDSVALQNMSSTPFPIGGQSVTPTTMNSVGSSNYGNAPSAYCVKCRSKKQIRDPLAVTMKNGRAAISGFCCDCGTRVFRIGRSAST